MAKVDTFQRDFTGQGLVLPPGDYVSGVETDSVTETYTYRRQGASGTITGTVVVVYSSSSKLFISSITTTLTGA